MPRTTPRVSFGLYALEIKQDSTPVMPGLQPFADATDLRTDNTTSRPYASYEPNFWLLDGQYKFLPAEDTTIHVGLMSLAQSDASGAFAVPPVLTVTFQQVHTSDGLALRFSTYTGDYANSITVAYYNVAGVLIRSDDYTPEGTEFSTGQGVENFKKIIITFRATSRPYRYLRLTGIDYGELISFEGTEIKAASVVEENDPLSCEVRINTLDLTLYSANADFSIINPSGYYAALKERQPLAVYEQVDNVSYFIGQFYLDEWENESDQVSIFRAVDLIGVLDRMTYRGGIWLGAGIALEVLIEQVLGAIYVPYELDSALYGVVLRGWLPICSYREALQQIGLAAGASVSCARSGAIRIGLSKIAQDETAGGTITRSQKGTEQRLALRSMVTGVEVTAHNYVASTISRELYNDQLPVGQHEIRFSGPYHTLSITGATILESGVNYALLNVTTAGPVVLSGREYTDTTALTRVTTPDLTVGVRPHVLQVTDATLLNSNNVASVADRVYRYYQQRYRQTVKLYAPTVEVGQTVLVDTLYGRQLRGVVEKMNLDLAGGFTARAEIVGVVHELD